LFIVIGSTISFIVVTAFVVVVVVTVTTASNSAVVSVLWYAQVAQLKIETCSKRLAALQEALQLQQEAAGRLVLRQPQLLVMRTELLQQLVGQLVQLLGGVEAARKLVLQDPKVT
jgi:hypothetical protein